MLLLSATLPGCSSIPYRHYLPYSGLLKPDYRPDAERKTYRALVNGRFLFKRFHLSGQLLIKRTIDSAVHVVFQNEAGFTFFHFAWYPINVGETEKQARLARQDSFAVLAIIPQLDKAPVIRLLRKDFAMLLLRECKVLNEYAPPPGAYPPASAGRVSEVLVGPVKGLVYYLGDTNSRLYRIEEWGKHKKVTTISFAPLAYPAPLPDSLLIRHRTANFTIQLYSGLAEAATAND